MKELHERVKTLEFEQQLGLEQRRDNSSPAVSICFLQLDHSAAKEEDYGSTPNK